jgi:hypothetical protein
MISCSRRCRIYLLVALSAAFLSGAALATTLARMDLDTLARSTEMIIRARCISTSSHWESGSIWTFAGFAVIETFKGAPPQELRVRLAGGRAGHLETKVQGVPRFVVGEEVVLFVERTSAGDYGVTSWAQGTFRVHRDAAGDVRLSQDTCQFAVFDSRTRQFAPSGIRNISLSEFRDRISAALTAPLPARLESAR